MDPPYCISTYAPCSLCEGGVNHSFEWTRSFLLVRFSRSNGTLNVQLKYFTFQPKERSCRDIFNSDGLRVRLDAAELSDDEYTTHVACTKRIQEELDRDEITPYTLGRLCASLRPRPPIWSGSMHVISFDCDSFPVPKPHTKARFQLQKSQAAKLSRLQSLPLELKNMIAESLPARETLALFISCPDFSVLAIRLPWVPNEITSIDQFRDDEYHWIDAKTRWEAHMKDIARITTVSGLNDRETPTRLSDLTKSCALDLSNETDSLIVYTMSYNQRYYICGLEVAGSHTVGYQSGNKYTIERRGQLTSFRFASDSIGIQSICLDSFECSSGWIPESPEKHAGYEGRRCSLGTSVLVITLDDLKFRDAKWQSQDDCRKFHDRILMRPRLLDGLDESKFYSLYDINKVESTFLFTEAVSFVQGSTLWIEEYRHNSKIQISNHRTEATETSFQWNKADGDFVEQIALQPATWMAGLCITFVTAHGRRKTVGELANPDKVHRTFKASKDRPFAGIYTWHGADGALYGMGVVYAGVVDLNS